MKFSLEGGCATEKKLLVLAGGFGTRLRTVVGDRPKPLADINGKPFLDLIIENWVTQGVRDFVFLLHYQSQQIVSHLDKIKGNELNACRYITLTEPNPMGTGGAIANAVRELELRDSFLVANADTWLGTGVSQLAQCNVPAVATINVASSERYHSITVDQDGWVRNFLKENYGGASVRINAGLYHLEPQDFVGWGRAAFSLEKDLFPKLAANGRLRAVPVDSEFIDIGVPDDYRRFLNWKTFR